MSKKRQALLNTIATATQLATSAGRHTLAAATYSLYSAAVDAPETIAVPVETFAKMIGADRPATVSFLPSLAA